MLKEVTPFSSVSRPQELEEETRALHYYHQLVNGGTYYGTFDEVWGVCGVAVKDSDYKAMIRDELPSYKASTNDDGMLNSCFSITIESPWNCLFL